MTPALGDRLSLADWRRRVAQLYGAVRGTAASDPPAAWELWRREREALFRGHAQSPVPAAERAAFRARHWPYDDRLRFEVVPDQHETRGPSVPPAGLAIVSLPDSGGDVLSFQRIGRLSLPLAAGPAPLVLYWMAGYAGGLFLPFRDPTNGAETYGAGRYLLDTAKSADLGPGRAPGSLVIDLNFAYHPSCAFDPRWACPLAGPDDRLDRPVHAGERLR